MLLKINEVPEFIFTIEQNTKCVSEKFRKPKYTASLGSTRALLCTLQKCLLIPLLQKPYFNSNTAPFLSIHSGLDGPSFLVLLIQSPSVKSQIRLLLLILECKDVSHTTRSIQHIYFHLCVEFQFTMSHENFVIHVPDTLGLTNQPFLCHL